MKEYSTHLSTPISFLELLKWEFDPWILFEMCMSASICNTGVCLPHKIIEKFKCLPNMGLLGFHKSGFPPAMSLNFWVTEQPGQIMLKPLKVLKYPGLCHFHLSSWFWQADWWQGKDDVCWHVDQPKCQCCRLTASTPRLICSWLETGPGQYSGAAQELVGWEQKCPQCRVGCWQRVAQGSHRVASLTLLIPVQAFFALKKKLDCSHDLGQQAVIFAF